MKRKIELEIDFPEHIWGTEAYVDGALNGLTNDVMTLLTQTHSSAGSVDVSLRLFRQVWQEITE